MIKYESEEIVCHDVDNIKKNKDGSITIEARVNIYTDEGCFTTVKRFKLEKY